jgi:hypothetical protein
VGSFPAHDQPHSGWPRPPEAGVEQAGKLGDVGVLTSSAVSVEGGLPHRFRDQPDRVTDGIGDRDADRILPRCGHVWCRAW